MNCKNCGGMVATRYVYWDGSGFSECTECNTSVIHMAGYFPSEKRPESGSVGYE